MSFNYLKLKKKLYIFYTRGGAGVHKSFYRIEPNHTMSCTFYLMKGVWKSFAKKIPTIPIPEHPPPPPTYDQYHGYSILTLQQVTPIQRTLT